MQNEVSRHDMKKKKKKKNSCQRFRKTEREREKSWVTSKYSFSNLVNGFIRCCCYSIFLLFYSIYFFFFLFFFLLINLWFSEKHFYPSDTKYCAFGFMLPHSTWPSCILMLFFSFTFSHQINEFRSIFSIDFNWMDNFDTKRAKNHFQERKKRNRIVAKIFIECIAPFLER